MKTRYFRMLSILLTAIMILSLSLNVHAASSNVVKQDGLEVQLFTDKDSYKANESIDVAVRIDNYTGKEVYVVSTIYAPAGMKLADGNAVKEAVLETGESWTSSTEMILSDNGSLKTAKQAATGDNMNAVLWWIVLILTMCGFLTLYIYGKNKKTWVSMLMCMVMVGGFVTAVIPTRAANASGSIEVSCNVQIDNTEAEASAEIMYVIYEEEDETQEYVETSTPSDEANESGETNEGADETSDESSESSGASDESSESSEVVPIVVTTADDVPMNHPELADFASGIAVLADSSSAYVNGNNVILSAAAQLSENGTDVLVSGKFLEEHLGIANLDSSTMYSLSSYAEAVGKYVLMDSRGMMVVTDSAMDAEENAKLLTMLCGYLETGDEVGNYAISPMFTQDIIDQAIAVYNASWPENAGTSYYAEKNANALYYLILAANLDENSAATDGTKCSDVAVEKIKDLISGGKEPFACTGCYWGHAIVASAMTLAKNTSIIWDQLTEEEQGKVDLLMEALAIAGNWGYNADNYYKTGFDLLGNFNKTWNPNFRNTYLSIVLSASMYFGADELNSIYTSFDYETYIQRLTDAGFTNILWAWTTKDSNGVSIGKYMEEGGQVYLLGGVGLSGMIAGDDGGYGVGVKTEFKYHDPERDAYYYADDYTELFSHLVEYTYAWATISEYGTPGTDNHTYILSENKTSPFEGQMGMMREFAAKDNEGIRSRCVYCYDSFEILVSVYANMKLLGYWNPTDATHTADEALRMCELDQRMYVGNEDFLFKLHEGYRGYSSGKGSGEHEAAYVSRGLAFVKDIWKNFHCMLSEEVVVDNSSAIVLEQIPQAEPKSSMPEGAYESVIITPSNTFATDAYYSIDGQNGRYTSANVSFDVVVGDDTPQEGFDAVVMLDQKASGVKWSEANTLIQFKDGTIQIYNGADGTKGYVKTGIRFAENYRYHVDASFDVTARTYDVTITQIWPEVEMENPNPATYTFTTEPEFSFRHTGNQIKYIDSIVLVNSSSDSALWIENNSVSDGVEWIPNSNAVTEGTTTYYYRDDFNDQDFGNLTLPAESSNKQWEYTFKESVLGDYYLNFSFDALTSGSNDYFISISDETLEEARNLTVEMDMRKPETDITKFIRIRYPNTVSSSGNKYYNYELISNSGNVVASGEILSTEWTHVKLSFDFEAGKGCLYVTDEAGITARYEVANAPSICKEFIRIWFGGENGKNVGVDIDNLKVYSDSAWSYTEPEGENPGTGETGPNPGDESETKTYFYYDDFEDGSYTTPYSKNGQAVVDVADSTTRNNKNGVFEILTEENTGNKYLAGISDANAPTDLFITMKNEDLVTAPNVIFEMKVKTPDSTKWATFRYGATGSVKDSKNIAVIYDDVISIVSKGTTETSIEKSIAKDGWTDVKFMLDFEALMGEAYVAGEKVSEFELASVTGGCFRIVVENTTTTGLYIDELKIYSDSTWSYTATEGEETPDQDPITPDQEEDSATKTYFYYDDFEDGSYTTPDSKNGLATVEVADNTTRDNKNGVFEIRTEESTGNKYLAGISDEANPTDLFITMKNADLASVSNAIIEMKIKTPDSTKYATFRYGATGSQKDSKNIAVIKEDELKTVSKGTTETSTGKSITKDGWTDMKFMLDFTALKGEAYVAGEKVSTFELESVTGGTFRIIIEKTTTTGLYIDELKIYSDSAWSLTTE